MPISLSQAFLLSVAGAVLLPTPKRRAVAVVGTVAIGLALAAFSVRLGDSRPGDLAHLVSQSATPGSFLQINSGLLILGLLLALVPAARELGGSPRLAALPGFILLVVTSVVAVLGLAPLVRPVGWLPVAGSAFLIGVGGFALAWLGRLVRVLEPWRRLDLALLERHPQPLMPALPTTADLVWFAGFLAASIAICFAPTLRAVSLATMIVAVTGHVLLRRRGAGTPVPVAALLALLMIPVFSYVRAISGDANPNLAELINAPFSLAAEVRIFPWVWLICFGLAALWPLHGLVFPLAAPIGAILLIRLGGRPLPDGAEHWAPLFMPLTLLGFWHAAATVDDAAVHRRRVLGLLTAGALFGILAGDPGEAGAWWLIASVLLSPWLCAGSRLLRIRWGLHRLVWLFPAYGGYLVVEAGLARQVTWTVLLAVGAAVAGWRGTMRLYLPR
ncbi:MAG: hypothetical protein ABI836_09710 [Gemmatimonadota bacterium]